MTYKQVYNVSNNQILITLPDDFKDQKQVTVIIEDLVDLKSQKISLMREASTDPLFLSDVEEVYGDFNSIDNETL